MSNAIADLFNDHYHFYIKEDGTEILDNGSYIIVCKPTCNKEEENGIDIWLKDIKVANSNLK